MFQTENVFAVPFRNRSEIMGGKAIRSEPQQLTISAAAREILERAGWLNYFNRLQEGNETVAIEFLQNLQDDHSIVRGKRIAVTDAIFAEVSGLPATGPVWTFKKERLQKVIDIFQDEGQHLTIKGKGILPATLGEPWTELARIVQSCITCEGRKDVVRPRHLKTFSCSKTEMLCEFTSTLKLVIT